MGLLSDACSISAHPAPTDTTGAICPNRAIAKSQVDACVTTQEAPRPRTRGRRPAQANSGASDRATPDAWLTEKIKQIHAASDGTYPFRTVAAAHRGCGA